MKNYLSLIKFSHTIFALPFAVLGFVLGVHELNLPFDYLLFLKVILCMVFARSAAMAFNRIVDWKIDIQNERTKIREIPAGIITAQNALTFVIINCGLFIITTYWINSLCFYLSPIALAIILGYSYTKRFTALCHLILGLGLSLAPIGAYLSVTAHFDLLPILYSLVVLTWVAGFDIIYALQDIDFDRDLKLYSIPSVFGPRRALHISNFLHLISTGLLLVVSYQITQRFEPLQFVHWIGVALFIGLLFYQHRIVSTLDLSRVNKAFFTANGIASVVLLLFLLTDFYIF